MKTVTQLVLASLCLTVTSALSAAIPNKTTESGDRSPSSAIAANMPRYIVTMYNRFPSVDSNTESHFLGQEVADSWTQFNDIYLRRTDVSVGMAKSDIDIAKPAIFNAVERINKYFRREINKGGCNLEYATSKLKHVLVCAKALYYEAEAEAIEKELLKAKTPQDMVAVFDRVNVEFKGEHVSFGSHD